MLGLKVEVGGPGMDVCSGNKLQAQLLYELFFQGPC